MHGLLLSPSPMIDGDWLRPVVSGLAGGMLVVVMAAIVGRAPADRAGWRRIVPSAMHWVAIGLGTALVLLMAWVRLFVGSARADAESQMAILTWLIVALALATVIAALSVALIRRRAVCWRGARIAWRRGGREVTASLAALATIRRDSLGYTVLHFDDGTALRIDPYARGAHELLEAAEARLAGT